MKVVEEFLVYLEKNKFYKLTPYAFTEMEIISFAYSKGFNFTRDSFQKKIQELSNTTRQLTRIERAWTRKQE